MKKMIFKAVVEDDEWFAINWEQDNMRSIALAFAAFALAGCATTTTEPVQIGKDSYMLSAGHTGLGSGLTSHAELRDIAVRKAAAFCQTKNQVLHLDSTQSTGVAGWGSIDDTVTFMCFDQNDQRNTEVNMRPSSTATIKLEK